MGWFDPMINVPSATFTRLQLLVHEVYWLEHQEDLDEMDLKEETRKFAVNILDEYIRQHFQESTKAAARLLLGPSHR